MFFVWALFEAGYHSWRRDHVRLKPKLKARRTHHFDTPVERNASVVANRVFSQIEVRCLTEAPLYECKAYMNRVQRFSGRIWEETNLDTNLILLWANTRETEIVQPPRLEKRLNIFFVQDNPQWMMLPCIDESDITLTKLQSIFVRAPAGAITAFRFHIEITCSDRIDGKLISIAPERCVLEATFDSDPLRPNLTLI